jgi:carbamoyltransferase
MYILGISAYYHGSAASSVKRFARIKQDEEFPINAVNYCLREAGINVNDLECIAFYDKPFPI